MSGWLLAAIIVGVLAIAVGALVVLPRSATFVAWRRRSHARWVGMDDLSEEELTRVITMRLIGGYSAPAARERVLRRRAIEEEIRRARTQQGHRGRGGRRRRARGR